MAGKVHVERVTVLYLLIFFVTGLFVFFLFQKQILDYAQYSAAAKAQTTSTTPQPAARGRILAHDKAGNVYTLAVSSWEYQLQISPRQVKNKQNLVNLLKVDIPTLDTNAVLAAINNNNVYIPPVMSGLDATTAEKITSKGYSGVFMVPVLARIYPDGANTAPQIIGFVGGDGAGKYGVEATYNDQLVGKSGDTTALRDSLGGLISVLGGAQPQAGDDVTLTIDYNLQFEVETVLKSAITKFQADSGSVIVMDPKTGAILADAGQPNFDPNDTSKITGADLYKLTDPNASLTYEPGSVIKPITMAMALDLGVVTTDTQHNAGGSVTILGHEIKNALNKNYGNETLSEIIQNSDNVQMSWISSLMQPAQQRDYLSKFGIGKKTGVDLVGEQTGSLPDIKNWNALLQATAAFGQGISTTVMQLATDYSVFANGGKTVTPHVVDHYVDANGSTTSITEPAGTQILKPETVTAVDSMLVNTVNLGEGKKAGVAGMQVAGKTGTAQVPDPKGGYDPTKSIGSFAGYFPAGNPQFVMVVRLDNPKTVNFAESSAAPTFGEIAAWMTNYYGLK